MNFKMLFLTLSIIGPLTKLTAMKQGVSAQRHRTPTEMGYIFEHDEPTRPAPISAKDQFYPGQLVTVCLLNEDDANRRLYVQARVLRVNHTDSVRIVFLNGPENGPENGPKKGTERNIRAKFLRPLN